MVLVNHDRFLLLSLILPAHFLELVCLPSLFDTWHLLDSVASLVITVQLAVFKYDGFGTIYMYCNSAMYYAEGGIKYSIT